MDEEQIKTILRQWLPVYVNAKDTRGSFIVGVTGELYGCIMGRRHEFTIDAALVEDNIRNHMDYTFIKNNIHLIMDIKGAKSGNSLFEKEMVNKGFIVIEYRCRGKFGSKPGWLIPNEIPLYLLFILYKTKDIIIVNRDLLYHHSLKYINPTDISKAYIDTLISLKDYPEKTHRCCYARNYADIIGYINIEEIKEIPHIYWEADANLYNYILALAYNEAISLNLTVPEFNSLL